MEGLADRPGATAEQSVELHKQLRQPASRQSVDKSLPLLFTGDLFTAKVATMGLNPVVDESGRPARGGGHFETLGSLSAPSRTSLTSDQCEKAIEAMRAYFGPSNASDPWFDPLRNLLNGMGCSYERGSAVHLDLIQESTKLKWSELWRADPVEAGILLARGVTFLEWQINTFPLLAVLCDGRTVLSNVCKALKIPQPGELGRKRIKGEKRTQTFAWYAARSRVNNRLVLIAGWNRPLFTPTGMKYSELEELGRRLGQEMKFTEA